MSGAELGIYIQSAGWIIDMPTARDKAALQMVPAACPVARLRPRVFFYHVNAHSLCLAREDHGNNGLGGRYGIM